MATRRPISGERNRLSVDTRPLYRRGPLLILAVVALVGATKAHQAPLASPTESMALELARGFVVDPVRASRDLAELTKEPHVFGSKRQKDLAQWLQKSIQSDGLKAEIEEFAAEVPVSISSTGIGVGLLSEQVKGRNLIAKVISASRLPPACVIALASHYDTKKLSYGSYVGANDSGSSTVLLLQLLAYLQRAKQTAKLPCSFVAWFFDGEEALLPNWFDSQYQHPSHIVDHTYGSRYAASRLTSCESKSANHLCMRLDPLWPKAKGAGPRLAGLVLLDMVGTPNLKLTRELKSTPSLLQLAMQGSKLLGYPNLFDSDSGHVEDDHSAFLERGIDALNLIDFNHLQHWHQPSDTASTVSFDSLQIAGRVALFVATAINTTD